MPKPQFWKSILRKFLKLKTLSKHVRKKPLERNLQCTRNLATAWRTELEQWLHRCGAIVFREDHWLCGYVLPNSQELLLAEEDISRLERSGEAELVGEAGSRELSGAQMPALRSKSTFRPWMIS